MKFEPVEFALREQIKDGTRRLEIEDIDIQIKRSKRSHYLGMSSITKCGRLLWVEYHHPQLMPKTVIEERLARIFDLGHICEEIMLRTLKAGGADVSDEQRGFEDFNGAFRGHCDCILERLRIGEIKSMNQHSFDLFTTSDLQTSHFAYYVQVNLYAYYSKLFDGILIAMNKNTSQVECQRIAYDQSVVDFHRAKVDTILTKKSIFDIDAPYIVSDFKECTFCPLKRICHGTN